ncbi:hypothetical protein [Streptomyces tailanensis]|uniref:hypothetical protein n=1 Tax=Streptomyces tailanensis TaxID=2569858 RepID=UPI00122E53CF|nr:hypothetical protein [Streptomyces tailanensis]
MSAKNSRLRIALVSLTVAAAALTMAGPAAAATYQPTTAVSTADQTPAAPTAFVDLPTPLPADTESHEVEVTYHNDSTTTRTVAPQLLAESPDSGPFLTPSDLKIEHRTATGCWEPVPLGTQTGTLFTDLTTVHRTIPAGETLTEVYRITLTNPDAKGTLHPRVALFD